MRTIRISEKAARAIWRHWEGCQDNDEADAFCVVRDALAALDRKRSSKVSHKSRKPTKAEKRDARSAIREVVFLRAANSNDDPTDYSPRCEGPRDHDPALGGRCRLEASELAHVFGRGKGRLPESERTCLALCHWCHKRETLNEPSGGAWWVFFAALFTRLGWTFEATEAQKRAHFEATRSKLGAGLKSRGGGAQ